MDSSQLKSLKIARGNLDSIINCQIENGDVHDHYDCREDLKQAVADLTKILQESEA